MARPKRLRVGDYGRLTIGVYPTLVEVVEDRGELGVGGRQIVAVRTDTDAIFEVPATALVQDDGTRRVATAHRAWRQWGKSVGAMGEDAQGRLWCEDCRLYHSMVERHEEDGDEQA